MAPIPRKSKWSDRANIPSRFKENACRLSEKSTNKSKPHQKKPNLIRRLDLGYGFALIVSRILEGYENNIAVDEHKKKPNIFLSNSVNFAKNPLDRGKKRLMYSRHISDGWFSIGCLQNILFCSIYNRIFLVYRKFR